MANDGVDIEGYDKKGSYHPDDATQAMSLEHMKDTYNYNIRHAEDHLRKAREACHKLINMGKAGEVETPKSILDLFKYFEQTKDLENASTMPLDKLRKRIGTVKPGEEGY